MAIDLSSIKLTSLSRSFCLPHDKNFPLPVFELMKHEIKELCLYNKLNFRDKKWWIYIYFTQWSLLVCHMIILCETIIRVNSQKFHSDTQRKAQKKTGIFVLFIFVNDSSHRLFFYLINNFFFCFFPRFFCCILSFNVILLLLLW